MTCQLCGEEITGSYARLKKFGFDEYATFHVENGSGRTGSCWEMWMEQYLSLSNLRKSMSEATTCTGTARDKN
jgi:hypothetical protein